MKKILFMLTSMNIGGVEKSLISLLSAMAKDKYDITLLLLEKKGGFLEYIPEWVRVEEASWFKQIKPIIMQTPQQTIKEYFNKKRYLKIPSFTCSYLISKYFDNRYGFYKQVLKDIPNERQTYDIAIAYQGPTDIIDFFIANKVMAKKKISWIHFDVSKHAINSKLYKALYKKFDKLFIVSREAENRLHERIPSVNRKTDVLHNLIPFPLIRRNSKEEVKFDDQYRGLKIVTVGRLSEEKGQDVAIKALFRLRQEGYEVRWYCIGEGNYRGKYEEMIDQYDLKKDFILLGSTPNPYPYIAKADIYVQTSRHEGYCLTLAEAKCLHRPIITTDFLGAYEQIENGKTGFIVGCREEELYTKIKYLINHPLERKRLSHNLLRSDENKREEVQKLFNYIN